MFLCILSKTLLAKLIFYGRIRKDFVKNSKSEKVYFYKLFAKLII